MFVQFSGGPCKEIASAGTDDPLAIFFSLKPTQRHKCFAPVHSEAKSEVDRRFRNIKFFSVILDFLIEYLWTVVFLV